MRRLRLVVDNTRHHPSPVTQPEKVTDEELAWSLFVTALFAPASIYWI